ncbi:MAG: LexA family transcriptional regulator [Pseudomonadota bacterium]
MKKSWRDLAKARMKDIGMTQDSLAEALGKTQGGIGHWLNGRRDPSIEEIASVMKVIGLKELILNSDGTVNDTEHTNVSNPRPHINAKKFPLISWVSAGQWCEAVEPYMLSEIDKWPETTADAHDQSFWLEVKGDSMTSPSGLSIPEGMIILVDPAVEASSGRLVVAKLETENEATFKKFVVDAGNKYLKPLNPAYSMTPINGNCRIVGVVIEAKWEGL